MFIRHQLWLTLRYHNEEVTRDICLLQGKHEFLGPQASASYLVCTLILWQHHLQQLMISMNLHFLTWLLKVTLISEF